MVERHANLLLKKFSLLLPPVLYNLFVKKQKLLIACVLFIVIAICTAKSSASSLSGLGEQSRLFEQALEQIGLPADAVCINNDDLKFFGGDKYKLPYLDLFFAEPFKISSFVRTSSQGNLALADKFASIQMGCANRTGKPGGYNADALKPLVERTDKLGSNALATALSELTGSPVEQYTTSEYKKMPNVLQRNVAVLILALPEVLQNHQRGLVQPILAQNWDPQTVAKNVLDLTVYGVEDNGELERVLQVEKLLEVVDFPLLNTGANLLATATQNLRDELVKAGDELNAKGYCYRVQTPLGWIELTNTKDDVHPQRDYLLLIDTCGNDRYGAVAGTRSPAQPISICIDLEGNDRYEIQSEYSPALGGGIFGYGILIDQAGNDFYSTQSLSLGCGIFGVGVFQDVAGDDRYESHSYSQAAAAFGTAAFIDLAGNDTYDIYNYGQGFAYTASAAILIDKTGDDRYTANDTDIKYPGPQTDKHNTSFAQGTGYGRRADLSDGHSWAGGVGILIDGSGNDNYSTGTFGQGVGYWYAVGILVDKSGNDTHTVPWYGMGAAPHFALGILQDDAGNDKYVGYMSQTLGQGRDLSIGWFEDSNGDDFYIGANRTLGSSDIGGIGMFWDKHGNDTYLACGDMFGQSATEGNGSIRDYILTLGMFIEGSGTDRYLALPAGWYKYPADIYSLPEYKNLGFSPLEFAGNAKIWRRPHTGPAIPAAYGIAIDAE